MGLIILPSQVEQGKTFHVLRVQPYLRNGLVRGHIDADIAAAICLRAAEKQGCEDMVIGLEGMIPRRYTVRYIKECIARNPLRYIGWIPQPTISQAQAIRNRMLFRRLLAA